MSKPKIEIFAGHYGSGKTNLAVNAAFNAKKSDENVILCDLDIVNPYFRTTDSKELLQKSGIRLISPKFANSNVDLPALPPEIFSVFNAEDTTVIFDVGGDDVGAVALGRFADLVKNVEYNMYLVINKYRYLTQTADEVTDIMKEIENSAHVNFTGIINNSNLGVETDENTVISSLDFANEVSHNTNLPLVYTSVKEEIYPKLKDVDGDFIPIKIYGKNAWVL